MSIFKNIQMTTERELQARVDNLPLELLKAGKRSLRALSIAGRLALLAHFGAFALAGYLDGTGANSLLFGLIITCLGWLMIRPMLGLTVIELSHLLSHARAVDRTLHPRLAQRRAFIILICIAGAIIFRSITKSPAETFQPTKLLMGVFMGMTSGWTFCWIRECAILIALLREVPPKRPAEAKKKTTKLIPIPIESPKVWGMKSD